MIKNTAIFGNSISFRAMAFANALLPLPLPCINPTTTSQAMLVDRLSLHSLILSRSAYTTRPYAFSTFRPPNHRARADMNGAGTALAADALTNVKHVLLPILDRNPYLSEGTRQAAATTTALAKKYGANITVIVIDEKPKDSIPQHDTQLSSIRWHLSEGGFKEFGLMERLGEAKIPTAIIGEVADDMNLDMVILSMEAIHAKHVDANLLAEFIPCPVLLLPL